MIAAIANRAALVEIAADVPSCIVLVIPILRVELDRPSSPAWLHSVLAQACPASDRLRPTGIACQPARSTHAQLDTTIRRSAQPSRANTPAGSDFGAC